MDCTCGRPTRDNAYTCDTCLDQFARVLGDITWLDNELETTIAKQAAATSNDGGRSAETALIVNLAASNARTRLRTTLVQLVRLCNEEHVPSRDHRNTQPAINIVALSRWLLWRVDGLAYNDLAPALIDDATDAYKACERVIDRRPDKWFAGPCNAVLDDDGTECGADMYALKTTGRVECHKCGTLHDMEARREWLMKEAEDHLADAATISRAVTWLSGEPLRQDRIRQWASRGRIVAKGHTADGRPLYRIGDAIDLLAETAA